MLLDFMRKVQIMSDVTLDETAIHLHELYSAFCRAGFTKEEAFDLVKTMVKSNSQGGEE